MLFEGKDRRELQQAMKSAGRLPPGQSLTLKWPVLHYGNVPKVDPYAPDWRLKIFGLCDEPYELTKLPGDDLFRPCQPIRIRRAHPEHVHRVTDRRQGIA